MDGAQRNRRGNRSGKRAGGSRALTTPASVGRTSPAGSNNKLPCAWGAVKVMLASAGCPQIGARRLSSAPSHKGWISSSASIRQPPLTRRVTAASRAATGGSSASQCFTSPTCSKLVESLVRLGYGSDPAWRMRSRSSGRSRMHTGAGL